MGRPWNPQRARPRFPLPAACCKAATSARANGARATYPSPHPRPRGEGEARGRGHGERPIGGRKAEGASRRLVFRVGCTARVRRRGLAGCSSALGDCGESAAGRAAGAGRPWELGVRPTKGLLEIPHPPTGFFGAEGARWECFSILLLFFFL